MILKLTLLLGSGGYTKRGLQGRWGVTGTAFRGTNSLSSHTTALIHSTPMMQTPHYYQEGSKAMHSACRGVRVQARAKLLRYTYCSDISVHTCVYMSIYERMTLFYHVGKKGNTINQGHQAARPESRTHKNMFVLCASPSRILQAWG